MTTNALTNPLSFEDRLRDRLRANIGDVMSDEDLAGLVERGLDDLLFKERLRKERHGGYNPETTYDPPLLHELLMAELRPLLKQAVADWLAEHQDEVMAAFDQTMEQGLGQAMLTAFAQLFDNALQPVRQQIYDVASQAQQR